MIINTGQRTDIPAFYSDWFYHRIKEGFVDVRNPYHPHQILEYSLDPQVVDCLCFCTKNPLPMLSRLDEIQHYHQYWFVTITPYDQEIEPHVPHFQKVIKSFQELSLKVGTDCIAWRYDPIFINQKYTIEEHLHYFEIIARQLSGYTHQCVISFIDLYEKTKRHFVNVQEVSMNDRHFLASHFVKIAKKYDIDIRTCLEGFSYEIYDIDCTGCMSQRVIEKAIGEELVVHKKNQARKGCDCLLGADIGAYNSCLHGCLYCYANGDFPFVYQTYQKHDPYSSLLIGHVNDDDQIVKVKQVSWINRQLSLDI